MTNTEKNRLIEAFMGWELKYITDYDLNQWCFVNSITGEVKTGVYNKSTVPYCSDWNLLMKALKKFDTMEYFKWNEGLYSEYSKFCDQIDYAVTLYNIGDAVNALCEGIEWYNSTSNSTLN